MNYPVANNNVHSRRRRSFLPYLLILPTAFFVALFTAWKDGKAVGRISAQIDHEHLRIHEDNAGFFGFFDTIDDQEVASALLDAAEDWLARRGMSVMRGPFSLSINEETGLLVEHLTQLRRGEAIEKPIYDYTEHRRAKDTAAECSR